MEIKLDHPLLPSRGIMSRSMDISKIPYEIASESVTDSWYPGNIIEGTSPFIMRDVRGTSVIVHPFQYNAATQILRVYKDITVTLTDNDTKPENQLITKSSTIVSEMSGMYKGMFINYDETKVMDVGELGEILIVYTSSYGGLAALQPYIQWKEEMGYTVNTLEVSYGTDLYVSDDIQTEYDSNPNILYVQLVGDWAALKSEYLNSSTSTMGSQDPMLGCVVGTDQYMDIIVGRFSVEDEAGVTNQINKAINYEKNPEIGGSWYDTCLNIAGDEGPGDDGEIDYEHSQNIIDGRLLPFTYTTANTVYQSLDSYTKTKIVEYLEDGTTIVNYTGHGNYDCFQSIDGGYYYNSDLLGTINQNRLPVVISVACLVGNLAYTGGDCFAETWLRHTNGGAVVGMWSTISQPWYPPMVGQDYFNDILVGGYDYSAHAGQEGVTITEQRTHFGSIAVNASNQMLLDNPTDASTRDTQEAWTIFGDVTVQMRTDQPTLIDNSNTTLLPGNYSTTITASGSPVEGARVTLYQSGVNVTGLTNSSGNVSLDHGFAVASDVTVTVTGFNLETEQSIMMVTGDIGGTFAINETSLSYGSVSVGSNSSQQFIISNSHNSETLTGDIVTITGYVVSVAAKGEIVVKSVKNTLSYSVGPNDTKTFNLVFEPTSAGSFNGNITITSSDTNHSTEYVSVSGTGIVPDINLDPTSLSATAASGGSAIKTFDVENTDSGTLDYSISINYTGGKEIKGSGGPDTFGYKWTDSDEVGGPVYNWVDITGIGTSVTLGDDELSSDISIGFDFNFYGNTYNTVKVCSNGFLTFTDADDAYTNGTIPSATVPNDLLALIWDDLSPNTGGNIYYYYDSANSRFIVEYNGVPHYNTTSYNTAQVLIYSSGKIVYQYQEVGASTVNTATVGIENFGGTDGSTVIKDAAYLKANLAIQFQATAEWLSLDSNSGSIVGVGSDTITATCDATDLEDGVYTADIIISSNDLDEATKTLPVTFTVGGDVGGTFAIDTSNLNYGDIEVGNSSVDQFMITNSHSTESISGTITTITGYTVGEAKNEMKNTLPYNVAPNSSKTFNLTFEPLAEIVYNGNITITSSDTNHATEYISVTGTAPAQFVIDSYPWNEGFEGGTFAPDEWATQVVSSNTWELTTGYTLNEIDYVAQEGTNFAYVEYHATESQDEWMITPLLDFSSISSPELSFWFHGSYEWTVTTPNCMLTIMQRVDGGSWNEIWRATDHASFNVDHAMYTWFENTMTLTDYTKGLVQLAFVYIGTDGAKFAVDNIM
ncbi:MAG: choice-of-anchor D domain-containing protein, partial [Candidatus Delongbacteria bacterium]|nr:choice-of-anchor D domain-containing protein [Candidatus Delongbacteria bacterium]